MDGLALAQLVKDTRAALGLSLRECADKATKARAPISHGRIGQIERGDYGTITDGTIAALAAALDLSYPEVARAAGAVATSRPVPFNLPPDADRLSTGSRKAIRLVVQALLDAYDDGFRAGMDRTSTDERASLRAVARGGNAADRAAVTKLARDERRKQGK